MLCHVFRSYGRRPDHCHADELPVRRYDGRNRTDGNDDGKGSGSDPGRLSTAGVSATVESPVLGTQRRGFASQAPRSPGKRWRRVEFKGKSTTTLHTLGKIIFLNINNEYFNKTKVIF